MQSQSTLWPPRPTGKRPLHHASWNVLCVTSYTSPCTVSITSSPLGGSPMNVMLHTEDNQLQTLHSKPRTTQSHTPLAVSVDNQWDNKVVMSLHLIESEHGCLCRITVYR